MSGVRWHKHCEKEGEPGEGTGSRQGRVGYQINCLKKVFSQSSSPPPSSWPVPVLTLLPCSSHQKQGFLNQHELFTTTTKSAELKRASLNRRQAQNTERGKQIRCRRVLTLCFFQTHERPPQLHQGNCRQGGPEGAPTADPSPGAGGWRWAQGSSSSGPLGPGRAAREDRADLDPKSPGF